jgi:hypothetical protein
MACRTSGACGRQYDALPEHQQRDTALCHRERCGLLRPAGGPEVGGWVLIYGFPVRK